LLIRQFKGARLSPKWGKNANRVQEKGETLMNKVCAFLSLLVLAVAIPAGAQTNSKNIARIYTIRAKPGQEQQWEAGLKKLQAWEHQQNLPGTYYVWSVISGPNIGDYILGEFGHAWADFDEMQARAEKAGFGKELDETVAPYTESVGISYYAFLTDLAITPPDPNKPPMPMSEVNFFNLKPGGLAPAINAIKQANAAIKKTHWPGAENPGGWYVLVDGGEGPQLVLSGGLKNWAGMQEPSPSFEEMLEQVYGKAGAHALGHMFYSHVRSESSEIIRYRPDLSYNAAQ
jgi:hypothetical protein